MGRSPAQIDAGAVSTTYLNLLTYLPYNYYLLTGRYTSADVSVPRLAGFP